MTAMRKITLEVQVGVRGPFLFRGLEASAIGVDASALRSEKAKLPVLPGDHLRGHLRAALQWMEREAPKSGVTKALIADLLGSASPEVNEGGEHDRPSRGRLRLADLVAETMLVGNDETAVRAQGTHYTRVAIDDDTGTAAEGMLQTVELAVPAEAVALFRGRLIACWNDVEANPLTEILGKALRLVPAMGGLKSAGYGEVVVDHVSVSRTSDTALVAAAPRTSPPDRLAFDISFDRPILVDAEYAADNVMKGRDVIPGGALKGALARAFELAGEAPEGGSPLGRALTAVVIGHAFPLKDDVTANAPLPLSLVVAGSEVRDAAAHWEKEAFLINGNVPAFASDWKEEEKAAAEKAWKAVRVHIPGLPRGRTAINADGVARDHALFVTVARSTADRLWRFTIDRNGAEESAWGRIIATLRLGLGGLGRTDAAFIVEKEGEPLTRSLEPLISDRGDVWPILLETQAVMTDPANPTPLEAQYQAFFRARSNLSTATLEAHFSRRRIAGRYAAVRFRAYGAFYRPFELTEAGSLFLVSGITKDVVRQWCVTGLEAGLPQGDGGVATLDWRRCPFVAGNGYGAVSVNAADHRRLAGEVEYV